MGWFPWIGVLFFVVVLIIVVGGYKFRPRRPADPPFVNQRFLQWLLPERAYAAIERGTRQWVIECKCGLTRDFWEAGGVRHKAVGERRMFTPCERCQRITWQKLRKPTPVSG